jgi:hypothetical protein
MDIKPGPNIPNVIFPSLTTKKLYREYNLPFDQKDLELAKLLLRKYVISDTYTNDLLWMTLFFKKQVGSAKKDQGESSFNIKREENRLAISALLKLVQEMSANANQNDGELDTSKFRDLKVSITYGNQRRKNKLVLSDSYMIYERVFKNIDFSDIEYWVGLRDQVSLKRAKSMKNESSINVLKNRFLYGFKQYLDDNKLLVKTKAIYPEKQMAFIADWFISYNILAESDEFGLPKLIEDRLRTFVEKTKKKT